MTGKINITEPGTIWLGPRTSAEIKRRVNELETRLPRHLTAAERKELHKLRVFIHLSQGGGHDA